MNIIFVLAFIGVLCNNIINLNALPCNPRQYPDGIVCVCDENYCDTLDDVKPIDDGIVLISTSKHGSRFDVTQNARWTKSYDFSEQQPSVVLVKRSISSIYSRFAGLFEFNADISVNRDNSFQTNIGFGGAFTGAVSHILQSLPTVLQHHIYKSYYSLTDGIGYNLMRISIGGSDFDLAPWAYNESPVNDFELSNFTKLDERDIIRIAQINDLKSVTNNNDIKVLGAAWSPPKWMKTNNDWTGISALRTDCYDTWAKYHVRYLELMSKEDVPLWGISTGNEPLNGIIGFAFVHFMSLGWIPGDQARWVSKNLGPLVRGSAALRDTKLLAGDDQRYIFPVWFDQMNSTYQESIDYLDGFAVHWYWDQIISSDFLDSTHENFPNKFILNTESCVGDKPLQTHGPVLGSWDRAEQYATSYIEDFNHWVTGWIDWNLILDEQGGPNYVNNFVDSPIIVNTTTNREFYKQPIFYVIGHFSKFILPGSVRIDVKSSHVNIHTVGYRRPDNVIVVILLNISILEANIKLHDQNRTINLKLPAKSIHTLLYY